MTDQARAALHDVLAETDNAGQLKVCLLDGVNRYVADMRAADKHGFMSLRAFIADGEHGGRNIWNSIDGRRECDLSGNP